MMLSKFTRVISNSSFRYSPVLASKTAKTVYNCTNVRVPQRTFYFNSYELQKISPKPNSKSKPQTKNEDVFAQSIGYYSMAVVVLCAGLTFAAVPLYRLFCQVRGKPLF